MHWPMTEGFPLLWDPTIMQTHYHKRMGWQMRVHVASVTRKLLGNNQIHPRCSCKPADQTQACAGRPPR
jgi:hypothetical protein